MSQGVKDGMASPWADGAADAQLRRLAGEGYSATQIAEALSHKGWFVSKSAIIGRARRIGVALGQGRARRAPAEPIARRVERDAAGARKRRAARREREPARIPTAEKPVTGRKRTSDGSSLPPMPMVAEVPAEDVPGIAFTAPDLRHDACRWPLRGAGLRLVVCGATAGEGASYCAAHHRMAYVRGSAREPTPAYDVHVIPARSGKRREADLVDAFASGKAA